MAQVLGSRALAAELMARGLIPPDCRSVELMINADGGLVIRYEQFVSADRLAAFADAMRAVATRAASGIVTPN
jgi:hypothetical protein